MMPTDLRNYVLADPAIADVIGSRMFPTIIPQGTTFPCIGYMQASAVRLNALDGPTKLAQWRMSFTVLSETYQEAKDLGDAIRKRLDGARGTFGTTKFGQIKLDMEIDGFAQEAGSEASSPGLHRLIQDYLVTFTET
jgi:hypothetical protein